MSAKVSYLLNLAVHDTPYLLSDLILSQYAADRTNYREIMVQADLGNVNLDGSPNPIFGGCEGLSPIRYAYQLLPGNFRQYYSQQSDVTTLIHWFMARVDNQKIAVEVIQ